MPATLAFVSVGDYGYEYYYKIVEGDYFGKTLAKVIADEKIAAPDRGDVEGRYEYEFIGWGVNADEYVVGTEKDSDGNVKTYISKPSLNKVTNVTLPCSTRSAVNSQTAQKRLKQTDVTATN